MIEGSRVRLRAFEQSDLPRFQDRPNDPTVTAGLTHLLPLSIEDEDTSFNSLAVESQEQTPLAIELQMDHGWRLADENRVFHELWIHQTVEFGCMIGERTLYDRLHGSETKELMPAHGSGTLNLDRTYLHAFASNQRARRSSEKAGFVVEGTLRRTMFGRAEYADITVRSIVHSEWMCSREGS